MVRKKVREGTIRVIPTRISVKNFGPVKEADIELRPLTVLMGPNNTGKTYTAILLLTAYIIIDILRLHHHVVREILGDVQPPIEVVEEELAQLYSVNSLAELVKKDAEKAEINLQFKVVNKLEDVFLNMKLILNKDGNLEMESPSLTAPPVMPQVVYIPAERAGMMRTYKQLLRLYLESIRLPPPLERRAKKIMGEETASRIRLPGVVRILLNEILSIDRFTSKERAESTFRNALEILEDEALQGVIEVGEGLSVTYTEKRSGQLFDLINTSSMVSELSAIYVLTRLLKHGFWFVIEEPEAHVHPRGQMGIARFLAALARSGVNVLITTHSDLIALKLANMVGLASLKENERERLGYSPDEYLRKEDLSIYFMEQREDGSIARRIEVSETGEVEELPTYSKVVEEMYGEAVKLLELHGKIPTLSSTEQG